MVSQAKQKSAFRKFAGEAHAILLLARRQGWKSQKKNAKRWYRRWREFVGDDTSGR